MHNVLIAQKSSGSPFLQELPLFNTYSHLKLV